MFGIIKDLFNPNEKEIRRLKKIVTEINLLEDKAKALKNEDFPKEITRLKKEVSGDSTRLTTLLPWVFALVREASFRVLGERHFDVQLMAGIVLHEGNVAEQKTGEGKTLSVTAPICLNALVGRGVHLITVNDYLARLHAGWMGHVYHFLGFTTAAIISDKSFIYDPNFNDPTLSDWRLQGLKEISRKEAYAADITYGINSEFGFDYLRDNMAMSSEDLVQRGYYYAIVDEVDSVLIDEARTPHIISAPYGDDVSKYYQYAQMVARLTPEVDYAIDEKLKTANLTEAGIEKIEKMLGVDNVYETDYGSIFHIEAALKARTLFRLDKDYIVRNNEIVIVDEFTGRLLEGRRFSEGIHQAIEAKENVQIKKESKTLATVSLQNYFRMYEKLSGMTGTAVTEAEEFHKIYKLNTVVMPTNKPVTRIDHPDYIYKTERGKFNALADYIKEQNELGRPVLVGTTSIEKNEILSALLKKRGIKHELLNAKNHEREALIISNAGRKGAVTVATNMAGRGVDIILGGNPPNKYVQNEEGKGNKIKKSDYQKERQEWQKTHDEVIALGGLAVIGTERHESRRIDNQLRGRSGRQGDPGETRFFISLEDEMLRIFGGEQIGKMMTFFNFPEDQPIEHGMVSKAIEQAQVKVEGFNFDIRKHLLDFDDVLNKQREIIYGQRQRIMKLAEEGKQEFAQFLENQIDKLLGPIMEPLRQSNADIPRESLYTFLEGIFTLSDKDKETLSKMPVMEMEEMLRMNIRGILQTKQKKYGARIFAEAVKVLYISTLDHYFGEHLTHIDNLREGINLRGYAQLDPLNEYKKESYQIFNTMLENIRLDFFRRLVHLEVEKSEALEVLEEKPKKLVKGKVTNEEKKTPSRANNKKSIGRNDPCWCGSGKKWKKCHYPDKG